MSNCNLYSEENNDSITNNYLDENFGFSYNKSKIKNSYYKNNKSNDSFSNFMGIGTDNYFNSYGSNPYDRVGFDNKEISKNIRNYFGCFFYIIFFVNSLLHIISKFFKIITTFNNFYFITKNQ